MKRYDPLFLGLGTLFSLIPMYTFFGWIYVFNTYPNLRHYEKVLIYQEKILFNLVKGGYSSAQSSGLFILFCGLFAGLLLFISLLNSQYEDNSLKKIKITLFIINGLFIFFRLWSLM